MHINKITRRCKMLYGIQIQLNGRLELKQTTNDINHAVALLNLYEGAVVIRIKPGSVVALSRASMQVLKALEAINVKVMIV